MTDWEHIIIRVEKLYFSFVCGAQPKMELLAADAPLRCPVCRALHPFKPERLVQDAESDYSPEFGDEIAPLSVQP
jgi:hypothetical protein